MQLFLIRHGATEWSASGRHTGTTDLALSSEGVAELAPLSRELRRMLGESFTSATVLSSPLTRARVSAESVMGAGFPVRLDHRLVEFDYGDYEGLTTEQIREQRPGWDLWRDGCPRGETPEDAGRRADAFLSGVGGSSDPVVAFAHAHIIRIIAARAIGLDPQCGEIFTLDTATVSLVQDVRGKRVVRHWNVRPRA